LQQLAHLQPVGTDGGQIRGLDAAAGSLDRNLEIGRRRFHDLAKVARPERLRPRRHAQ
jgi:hypothetical protein